MYEADLDVKGVQHQVEVAGEDSAILPCGGHRVCVSTVDLN